MRLLFLLLALLVACPGARAQLVPAATPAVLNPAAAPAPVSAAPDTAAALHRLFALRREHGYTAFKVGGAMLAVSASIVASTSKTVSYSNLWLYVGGVLGLGSSVPVLASGVIRTVKYSEKREQRAQLAWQQHRLSPRLKRALEDDSLLAAQVRLARAAAPVVLDPDTAAALHRLFATKRHILRVAVPITTAVGAGLCTLGATQTFGAANSAAVVLGTTTLLTAAAELATFKKYSKTHEEQALLALKEHRLPAALRQQLKAEYFHPAKATP